jgi:phosphate transport system ATP-binding protein
VIVTHILRQAKRLADYVIFLYLGDVIEQGPANDIFKHPKEERTKAYIGGEIS